MIGQGGFEPPTSWSRTKRAPTALLPVFMLIVIKKFFDFAS